MRSLFDIIEAAKDNKPTTHEECLHAMLALEALFLFDHRDLRRIAYGDSKVPARMLSDESFKRFKTALDRDPRSWLGSQTPDNPEYQRMRKVAFKVLEAVEKKAAEKGIDHAS